MRRRQRAVGRGEERERLVGALGVSIRELLLVGGEINPQVHAAWYLLLLERSSDDRAREAGFVVNVGGDFGTGRRRKTSGGDATFRRLLFSLCLGSLGRLL